MSLQFDDEEILAQIAAFEQMQRDEALARMLQEEDGNKGNNNDQHLQQLQSDEEFARSLLMSPPRDENNNTSTVEEDEALARSFAEAEQPKTKEEEEYDYMLCLMIQAKEEEALEERRLLSEKHAEQALRAAQEERDRHERDMVALALHDHDLQEFPALGAPRTVVATTAGSTAKKKPVEEVQRHTNEIIAILTAEYPTIPQAFIEYAAKEAKGSLSNADTRVFKMYPKEYFAHKQLQHTTGGESQSKGGGRGIVTQITQIKGRKLEDIRCSGKTIAETSTGKDPVRETYLALATRKTYTADDLKRAYEMWSHRIGNERVRGRPEYDEQSMLDELNYHSARWDAKEIRKQIREDERLLALLDTVAEQDVETRKALEQKISRAEKELLASQKEAADLLFVLKNPKLLETVSKRNTEKKVLQVDLHTMHVSEALDRVHATIQYALRTEWLRLKIITGRGNHSQNMQARLGPEILEYLEVNEHGYVDNAKVANGAIFVTLKTQYQN